MIIGNVISNQTAQMNLIEDHHVVEKLSATVSNPAFRDSILPGTSEPDSLGFEWIRRIGCRMFSAFSGRAPLRAIRLTSDKMRYVTTGLVP
jgi:hypothetical protein